MTCAAGSTWKNVCGLDPAWAALVARLGYDTDSFLSGDFVIELAVDGWRCDWVRYYSGVRSDRRTVGGCASFSALLRAIHRAEDVGEQLDTLRFEER